LSGVWIAIAALSLLTLSATGLSFAAMRITRKQ
jgi:hypothetical protein